MKKWIWLGVLALNCAIWVFVFSRQHHQAVLMQAAMAQKQLDYFHFHRTKNDWDPILQKEPLFITAVVNGLGADLWVGTFK